MKCPKCGSELRRSQKDPLYGLCDNCKKKFNWIDELDEDMYEFDSGFENREYDFKNPKTHVTLTESFIKIIKGDHNYMISKNQRGEHTIPYSQIVEIKLKNATALSKGFIQFTTAQTQLAGALRTMNQSQNSIQFSKSEQNKIDEIKALVEKMM